MLFKELRSLLYSLSGLIFVLIFLIITGCLLWVIPGNYNISEIVYASMIPFFSVAPFLLLFLIPALGMRTFSEEKRNHTFSLLLTRPVSLRHIILSKLTAVWITALIALIPTLIYVISIYLTGNPVGSLDLGATAASYTGLLFLVLCFSSIAVFASALTFNQTISLIIGLLISALLFFGPNLLAGMFSSGKVQLFIGDLGLLSRYQSIQKGLVNFSDLGYLTAIAVLFFILTYFVLKSNIKSKNPVIEILIFILLIMGSYIFQVRMDWTKDKRFSLSEASKKILKQVESPIEMELYLSGSMNAGFMRLQNETLNTINDFNRETKGKITVKSINPHSIKGLVDILDKQNIKGIAVNEKDPNGKLTQQILYPWLKIKYRDIETMIYLLVNQQGKSGIENLNASVELLEYKIVQGIQSLISDTNRKIVFLEGHGELPEPYLEDISNQLSSSFQVDRGVMSNQLNQLNDYELVIIAGPQQEFTEEEKYILDQYVMQGGRILWIINGVQLQSLESLASAGKTVSRVNEVNLDDILFKYGIRINPVLIQDVQCIRIPINNDTISEKSSTEYSLKPWYYSPLLIPAEDSPITKGLPLIKSDFASTLSFIDSKNQNIKQQILLTSSGYSHIVAVPEIISLEETDRKPDETYFNESHLPVAALLEGKFNSVFINRIPPINVETQGQKFLSESQPTKMVVIASEDIIRNEIGLDSSNGHSPMGYDQYSGTTFGNRDFMMNIISYLTDDSGLMTLRSKSLRLELLNKAKTFDHKINLIIWNVVFPPVIILVLFLFFSWRRKKYHSFMYFCTQN